MNRGWTLYVLLAALALAGGGPAAAVASPQSAAAPGTTGSEKLAQMMGQGMMGQGMGPGMMQRQAPPQPGADGAAIFRGQCGQCHTLVAGPSHMPGPSLNGLFGRKAGTEPGYNYSPAMRKSGVVWNAQTLDQFIEAPQRFIPGNIMPFAGIANASVRQRLIAYLKEATK